jgi:hypothetical protein
MVATTRTLGPHSVDSAVSTIHHFGDLRDRRDFLIQRHSDHKARVDTVTHIASGDWYTEWPDLSRTPEAPTVANKIEMGINHWTAIGGAILPSIRVPINKTKDRRSEKTAARKRERRVREVWESSNATELAALLWGDYAGAGSATLGAWVNFEESDPQKRNPFLIRYDPRHTYAMKDNQGNITELLVARKMSKAELGAMYPQWAKRWGDNHDEEVEEWFWYMRDRMVYALVDVSKDGRKKSRHLMIVDEPWDLGFVPAWEAVRPTFDGQRRGVFDQSVHILRTMHRLMLMTIMSSEEHAFPAISSFDAINPEDFGPGAVIQMRSAEGRIDRLGPSSHFDIKDLIARLGEEASQQSALPQQLLGEPGASIISARGINASMGALDARLALAHKQFETLFSKVSGFALALDEHFCKGEKTIVGDERDTSPAEHYDPEKDVAGAWKVTCTYGIGAGSDPANIEVRLNMNLSNGLISRERAREQLPFLEDPEAESVQIFREAMQDSVIQGVLAMAQAGDPTMAAKALDLLSDKDQVDFGEILQELVDALLAPPEEAEQDPAEAAVQEAESLARGGIPGNAAQAPPGLGLPPLAGILGQDSRQVS